MLSSPYPDPPSTLWRVLMAVAWTAGVTAGAWVLIDTPQTYRGLGFVLTLAWGCLLILGSGLALIGHMMKQYRLELPGLYFALGGVAIYCYLSWEQTLTGSSGSGPRALLLMTLGCGVAARMVVLHILDRRFRRIDNLARG